MKNETWETQVQVFFFFIQSQSFLLEPLYFCINKCPWKLRQTHCSLRVRDLMWEWKFLLCVFQSKNFNLGLLQQLSAPQILGNSVLVLPAFPVILYCCRIGKSLEHCKLLQDEEAVSYPVPLLMLINWLLA